MELMTAPALHIRVRGRSLDLTYADVDLAPDATPDRVLTAVARHLEIDPADLARDHVAVQEQGVMFVRPIAVYG